MDREKPTRTVSSGHETLEEKKAAERAAFFAMHKAHGSLGVYYQYYPEDRPKVSQRDHDRESEGRGR